MELEPKVDEDRYTFERLTEPIDIKSVVGWDILTALRGPDYLDSERSAEGNSARHGAKFTLTNPIRWFVGAIGGYHPREVIRRWSQRPEADKDRIRAYVRERSQHFGSHIIMALYRLRTLNVKGAGEFREWLRQEGIL